MRTTFLSFVFIGFLVSPAWAGVDPPLSLEDRLKQTSRQSLGTLIHELSIEHKTLDDRSCKKFLQVAEDRTIDRDARMAVFNILVGNASQEQFGVLLARTDVWTAAAVASPAPRNSVEAALLGRVIRRAGSDGHAAVVEASAPFKKGLLAVFSGRIDIATGRQELAETVDHLWNTLNILPDERSDAVEEIVRRGAGGVDLPARTLEWLALDARERLLRLAGSFEQDSTKPHFGAMRALATLGEEALRPVVTKFRTTIEAGGSLANSKLTHMVPGFCDDCLNRLDLQSPPTRLLEAIAAPLPPFPFDVGARSWAIGRAASCGLPRDDVRAAVTTLLGRFDAPSTDKDRHVSVAASVQFSSVRSAAVEAGLFDESEILPKPHNFRPRPGAAGPAASPGPN